MEPIIKAVCISENKGIGKKNIEKAKVIKGFGIENDAHGGNWHRQISLLSTEKIKEMQEDGADVNFGDFGENIVTQGLDIENLTIDTKIQLGNEVILKVTQIGKECVNPCSIFHAVGYCIMPKIGIFTKVIHSGEIKTGDEIKIISQPDRFPVAIVVISDSASKGEKESTTEFLIESIVKKVAGDVKKIELVPDDRSTISQTLINLIRNDRVSLILTTGGTGLSPRDNTPEATRDVISKEIPGFTEIMRTETFKNTNKSILSRAVAGFRNKTMIINLPGSPNGVKECLEVVLPAIPHAIQLINGSVNNCSEIE